MAIKKNIQNKIFHQDTHAKIYNDRKSKFSAEALPSNGLLIVETAFLLAFWIICATKIFGLETQSNRVSKFRDLCVLCFQRQSFFFLFFILCLRLDELTELGAFMWTEVVCTSMLRIAVGPGVKLAGRKSALNPRWFILLTLLRRWTRC